MRRSPRRMCEVCKGQTLLPELSAPDQLSRTGKAGSISRCPRLDPATPCFTVLDLPHITPSYGRLTLSANRPGEPMRQAADGSVLELVVRHGPRFLRDACGPVLVFYAGWKIVGLEAGIAGATALAVVAYLWERRQSRSGLSPAIGLGIALVQPVPGLMSARIVWYFAPSLIVNAACGVVFVVSVVMGQPLAAL